jgi:hypothetical protein
VVPVRYKLDFYIFRNKTSISGNGGLVNATAYLRLLSIPATKFRQLAHEICNDYPEKKKDA